MKTKLFKKSFLIALLVIIFYSMILVKAEVLDPSTVYCQQLGYQTSVETTSNGEIGLCVFPDGTSCSSWEFLEGKCGTNYSYCKKMGYDIKTISDYDKCKQITSEECSVCILPNGTESEVTQLMQLKNTIGSCGDGTCGSDESPEKCPQDCSKNNFAPIETNAIIIILVVSIVILIIFLFYKKKSKVEYAYGKK